MIVSVWPPGFVQWPGHIARCALGRNGIRADKREGDGATPAGCFPLRRAYYRADRIARPVTPLPMTPLRPHDGWCDDPGHALYNRRVRRPFADSHERLWRADGLYDVIIEIGYNDDPVRPGRGSAIFIHVAGERFQATEGCVALDMSDLLELLKRCDAKTRIAIGTRPRAANRFVP